jgi:hypothetical protein
LIALDPERVQRPTRSSWAIKGSLHWLPFLFFHDAKPKLRPTQWQARAISGLMLRSKDPAWWLFLRGRPFEFIGFKYPNPELL